MLMQNIHHYGICRCTKYYIIKPPFHSISMAILSWSEWSEYTATPQALDNCIALL